MADEPVGDDKKPVIVSGRRWSYVDGKRVDRPPGKVFVYETEEDPERKPRRKKSE